MAKQLLISVLEDVVGEYLLNISKENIKIAALRGKINLENVQLDGDLIGSHVLGAVGLSGFGVLSCWAKSVKVAVPLGNIEKESTTFELDGVQLVCVPLLPSTAHKEYGAGTILDPRCSLRTRAKRSSLARLERNYFGGRIPGEGPPNRRIKIALRRAEKALRKRRYSGWMRRSDSTFEKLDNAVSELEDDFLDESVEFDGNIHDDLIEPQGWKARMREKMIRNMEMTCTDLHVRCEVAEGGLDFSSVRQKSQAIDVLPPDQRGFSFGVTIERMIMKGSDKDSEVDVGSIWQDPLIDSSMDHTFQNRLAEVTNGSIYWDDNPALLISETTLLRERTKLSPLKVQTRISHAMDALVEFQDPGYVMKRALQKPENSISSPVRKGVSGGPCVHHEYILRNLCVSFSLKIGDRNKPGPMPLIAEVLPCHASVSVKPHQLIQYQKLRSAMLSQQRFDTMLRQRPIHSPRRNPKVWWQYAVSCITTRPNSRPWSDVAVIARSRDRYIDLVKKKLINAKEGSGFHGGLEDGESLELLRLEDLLPIEVLHTFHLLALRHVYALQREQRTISINHSNAKPLPSPKPIIRNLRGKGGLMSLKKLIRGTNKKKNGDSASLTDSSGVDSDSVFSTREALLNTLSLRFGKKQWFTMFQVVDANLSVNLVQNDGSRIAMLSLRSTGLVRTFGIRKREFKFDLRTFEILDCLEGDDGFGAVNLSTDGRILMFPDQAPQVRKDKHSETEYSGHENGMTGLQLPPPGVVCRVAAAKDLNSLSLNVAAHPATVVWNQSCVKGIKEFFSTPSAELQTEVTQQLRHVATPLARKAVLALLSPTEVTVNVNVEAPKLWFPVSTHAGEGAVFVDAGTLRVSCKKLEQGTDLKWNVSVRDMQVKFDRAGLENGDFSSREISVLKPFHLLLKGEVLESGGSTSDDPSVSGTATRSIVVFVSPVCINLVDAEVLARAFGKWYAFGLGQARKRVSMKNDSTSQPSVSGPKVEMEPEKRAVAANILTVHLSKFEVALEGHSSSRTLGRPDGTRTYFVQLIDLEVKKTWRAAVSNTSLNIKDASIVRLMDSVLGQFDSMPSDMQHLVLVRMKDELGRGAVLSGEKKKREQMKTCRGPSAASIVSMKLFKDRVQHLDEVEIDTGSFVLRVTPTTLKDCAKGLKRILELVQLVTKEMERKVHEEGRRARRQRRVDERIRPSTPIFSEVDNDSTTNVPNDSSILFRVTLNEISLLAGLPIHAVEEDAVESLRPGGRALGEDAVVQLVTNALVMFQSIENADGSGSKTTHLSLDNLSATVMTDFTSSSMSKSQPMIGPTSAEFRVVYSTANLGFVVSQDISLDCEATTASLTPGDVYVLCCVLQKMAMRLRSFEFSPGRLEPHVYPDGARSVSSTERRVSPLVRYKKKGTGIATTIRLEVQGMGFILLHAFKSKRASRPLFDIELKQVKANFEGCVSALSGDGHAVLSVKHFNFDLAAWEDAVENTLISVNLDQMPNELVLKVSTPGTIQMNITGSMLTDASDIDVSVLQLSSGWDSDEVKMDRNSLATVGLRKSTESSSVTMVNETGLDFFLVVDSHPAERPGPIQWKDGEVLELDSILSTESNVESGDMPSISLHLAPSAIDMIGSRIPLVDLPIHASSGSSSSVFVLEPILKRVSSQAGRNSPDSFSDGSGVGVVATTARYSAEPVVEWCMQNQRLRSSIADVYSLEPGRDLLSATLWSPDDAINEEADRSTLNESDLSDLNESMADTSMLGSPSNAVKAVTTTRPGRSNWVRPYLKDDSPEWTDMTCILRMARDRVMLPDNNWIWLNDWTIDLSGEHSENTDADGWEYEADFETFNRTRRYYKRGDCCRRRRWTRTRMILPPQLEDPSRKIAMVWETSRDSDGAHLVSARSRVRIVNKGCFDFAVCVSSPSWKEINLGSLAVGEEMGIPVHLAGATFLRLGTPRSTRGNGEEDRKHDLSTRILLVPTGYTSSTITRAQILRILDDTTDQTETLQFLVHVTSAQGLVTIQIHPILRVVNHLPCQLSCEFAETVRSGSTSTPDRSRLVIGKNGRLVTKKDTISVDVGKEGQTMKIDPSRKPHVSFRVPGYNWSPWNRIVNRRNSSHTWQPPEVEEDTHAGLGADGKDYADEYKTVILLERFGVRGDPLSVILSVEDGHCPTLRIYAQYWILDKTGFGCRFVEGFTDMLGTQPDQSTSRRSYLQREESKYSAMHDDMAIPGHQWSIGMSGMSLFFSEKEKIAICIERGSGSPKDQKEMRSRWMSPLDVSNVMPKTVFAVDEYNGYRRFELAISVTICPGDFSRTKLITLFPRYQIVNFLPMGLVVAQDGCLHTTSVVSPHLSIPYHWENASLAPKVRLGSLAGGGKEGTDGDVLWTNGCIQLDKVGITSLRFPSDDQNRLSPLVVQVEVRLATKEQSSAVTVVVWTTDEGSNPLYVLKNKTNRKIICRQPLHDDIGEVDENGHLIADGTCGNQEPDESANRFECGSDLTPLLTSLFGSNQDEEFVWVLGSGTVSCFGFDDPEKPHILEWTSVKDFRTGFDNQRKSIIEVDAMGSSATHQLSSDREIVCQVKAEHSTKVIVFTERRTASAAPLKDTNDAMDSLQRKALRFEDMISSEKKYPENEERVDDSEELAFSFRLDLPKISVSVIDNASPNVYGREIMLGQLDNLLFEFSQNREGYHEFEFTLISLQVDNHVSNAIHPVLVFCPALDKEEPLIHISAVRRLQPMSSSLVFRYAAVRVLEIEVYLDRRTVESVASFIQPIGRVIDVAKGNTAEWVSGLTTDMGRSYAGKDYGGTREIESVVQTANLGRIYFEHLHLHPVRIGLTFTQEWIEWQPGAEGLMIFHFIRGMTSIANAPLKFTSFMVGNAFESPQTLSRIVMTHYSSQLTKQIFGILGSLAILGAPADFISNVGTGVRDFFYEPINGMVHGPAQFLEGLEAGTQSLARGVFVGVVRGAANVTEVVNSNLAGLTADSDFIDERKAHQRMLTDTLSRGIRNRTMSDSLYLAGSSVARGVRSGAVGIWEQPAIYASKHGPIGFVKGMGKALVGAIVKPLVGVGDATVLVLNHMSDATSDKQVMPKVPKRLRRALPRISSQKPQSVKIVPFDDRAAKAQKIVTGGESVDDIYIGHVNLDSHLIIASEECLWAIDRRTREPWCISWEEISHFAIKDSKNVRITVFSQTGLRSHVFHVEETDDLEEFKALLVMQLPRMSNGTKEVTKKDNQEFDAGFDDLRKHAIPGIKVKQVHHVFGSFNKTRKRISSNIKDEIDVIEQCFARVKVLGSESPTFFQTLDEEAWTLITSWGQVFSGLSSRRCIAAGIINGTGHEIQIKSCKLVEGGSPCYSIPTKEFDAEQGLLQAGGAIILFGWGVVPNLLQAGNVFMSIETNTFVSDLSDHKSPDTSAEALPGYRVGFLEKSYDESGWWAKYWILVRKISDAR